MAYKIKKSYFKEREMSAIRHKYKGKRPPFMVIMREAFRNVSGAIEEEHRKGVFVEYHNELAKVVKVEKKGIWIMPISELGKKEEKPIFVSENKIEKGKLYPIFLRVPMLFSNFPYTLEK
jgi:hypothetical protein